MELPKWEKVVNLPVNDERSYASAQILADRPATILFAVRGSN